MRSLKSGLVAIALAGIFGTVAVVGCSADGGGAGIATQLDSTEPAPVTEPGSVLPERSNAPVTDGDAGKGDSGTNDSGKNDSGKNDSGTTNPDAGVDAGVDAGPPPPVEGDACTTLNAISKKPCGACGTAETVCLNDGTGTGKGKWSAYGVCNGELTNGCVPGTVVDAPCGNCGTQKKTCNQSCAFTTAACTGQPLNSCAAGAMEYTTAGCKSAEYRNRTCSAACIWGSFSATCAAPVNDIVLNIPTTVGPIATRSITLSAAKQGSRLNPGACPQSSAPTAGNYPYQYVELKNTTGTPAKVTVFASAVASGPVIDTIMAGYSTTFQPMDDNARKACAYGVNDQSSGASDTALTGNLKFSILKAVPIPAGGSILIYVSTYYTNPPSLASEVTTGDINLNVKVEQFN